MKKSFITVDVKQKHINKGVQGNQNTCAIAVALEEMFDADEVCVSDDEITVEKSNGFSFKFEWNKISAAVKKFIEKFDQDKKSVKPFKFQLPIIDIKNKK